MWGQPRTGNSSLLSHPRTPASFLSPFLRAWSIVVLFFFNGCTGSLLLHVGFLQLQCVGFSLQWLLSLQSMDFRHMGFTRCGSQTQQLCFSFIRLTLNCFYIQKRNNLLRKKMNKTNCSEQLQNLFHICVGSDRSHKLSVIFRYIFYMNYNIHIAIQKL